jgi:hypothetical protein
LPSTGLSKYNPFLLKMLDDATVKDRTFYKANGSLLSIAQPRHLRHCMAIQVNNYKERYGIPCTLEEN